jgi:hypothetical protein
MSGNIANENTGFGIESEPSNTIGLASRLHALSGWHPGYKHRRAGIQVQRFDTDAADEADQAERSRRDKLSPRGPKKLFFCPCRGGLNAPGRIRVIRFIRGIRVEPWNLDASPTVF